MNLSKLKISDIGRWVRYTAPHGDYVDGRIKHGDFVDGRIKSWNDSFVFVVYKCGGDWDNYQNYTGYATKAEDLEFIKKKK